jgi:hypothetical protein
MQEIEFEWTESLTGEKAVAVIDNCLADFDLTVTLRDTLRSYPGCTHWHAKFGRERGILEATCWPAGRRIWLAVHENRRAPWIDDILPSATESLRRALF